MENIADANQLITWRLQEIMKQEGIRSVDLAEQMGLTVRWVQKVKQPTMPNFDQQKLEKLLLSLNLLKRKDSQIIRIQDLLAFALTPEELQLIKKAEQGEAET